MAKRFHEFYGILKCNIVLIIGWATEPAAAHGVCLSDHPNVTPTIECDGERQAAARAVIWAANKQQAGCSRLSS